MRSPTRPVLLALAAPALATALVWAVRPGVVENAVRSPVAWLVAVGVLAASLGVRAGALRLGAAPRVARALSTGLVLVLVAVVLAPSFRQRTLVEELPDGLAVAAAPSSAPDPATPAATPAASTAVTPAVTPAVPPAVTPAATPASRPPVAAASPAAPVSTPAAAVDRAGALDGIGHTARGTVRLRSARGASYVVFDDVDIEGSVGPSVHLVPTGQRRPGGEGIRLGALKAERGTFSYRLPAGVDLARSWSVLVWCDPYDTPIAAADLR